MKSDDVSTIALAPFVRFFTYAVVKSMRINNYPEILPRIHTDMVPRVSEKVMRASLGERTQSIHGNQGGGLFVHPDFSSLPVLQNALPPLPEPPAPKKNIELLPPLPPISVPSSPAISNFVQPAFSSPVVQPQVPVQRFESEAKSSSAVMQMAPEIPPRNNFVSQVPVQSQAPQIAPQMPMPPAPMPMEEVEEGRRHKKKHKRKEESSVPAPQEFQAPAPQMELPDAPVDAELTQFYGKITQLLNDSSISVIECSGMGQPIMVVRRGMRQPTKIVLSEKEINQVLDKVAEASHIPILEGVFRAAVDNFSINAVVSEMIGSRFVIKKQQSQGNAPLY